MIMDRPKLCCFTTASRATVTVFTNTVPFKK